jgi:hypothetical protein
MHRCIHICIHIHMFIYPNAHTYADTHPHTNTFLHTHAYIHTCTHTQKHTHIHMHTHTYKHMPLSWWFEARWWSWFLTIAMRRKDRIRKVRGMWYGAKKFQFHTLLSFLHKVPMWHFLYPSHIPTETIPTQPHWIHDQPEKNVYVFTLAVKYIFLLQFQGSMLWGEGHCAVCSCCTRTGNSGFLM